MKEKKNKTVYQRMLEIIEENKKISKILNYEPMTNRKKTLELRAEKDKLFKKFKFFKGYLNQVEKLRRKDLEIENFENYVTKTKGEKNERN